MPRFTSVVVAVAVLSSMQAAQFRRDPDPATAWKAAACAPVARGVRLVRGAHMQFTVPPGVSISGTHDVDYGNNFFCAGKECMRHGFGPTWSSSDKSDPAYFATAAELTHRDVYDPRDTQLHNGIDLYGNEYRGRRKDGTYFRWVGVSNESIEYDGVSQNAATAFDRVIDSLCWLKR